MRWRGAFTFYSIERRSVMELTAFSFDVADGVAHITMNQPERGNPIDQIFAAEFDRLASECSVRKDVRAVLIDAKGRFFSVGGDLSALTRSRDDLARFVSGTALERRTRVSHTSCAASTSAAR